MHSHAWNCDGQHDEIDCRRNYPVSNVRVITSFDRHVQQAMALANGPALELCIQRHPAGKGL